MTEDPTQIKTGNIQLDNAINNGINLARGKAAILHRRQMVKRFEVIKSIASANNHGNVNIMGATLSHIAELAEHAIHDYKIEEDQNDG